MKGFAIGEIIWERTANRILPIDIKSHEQRRFMFDRDWKPRLLTWTDMHLGEALPEHKFIVHRHGVKGNNPYGLGMGTRLFFPVLFKREGVTFWLKFLEKFASPTIVGKTPYGQLEGEQNKVLNILKQFHSNGAITVPVDVDVELLEAKRAGSMSGLEWCNYWDKQMSIAMLGETLTTDIGAVGSRAAAEVHSGVLDKLLLADTLQKQLITWLVEYNFPGAVIPRVQWKRPKDEKQDAETAKAEAAIAHNEALRAKLAFVADIDNDDVARSILITSDLVDGFDNDVIDALVTDRLKFKVAAAPSPLIGDKGGPPLDDEDAAFAALSFKKKR